MCYNYKNCCVGVKEKTGFTKKYKLKAYRVKELPESVKDEEIIFLGWLKAGKIQGKNFFICAVGVCL